MATVSHKFWGGARIVPPHKVAREEAKAQPSKPARLRRSLTQPKRRGISSTLAHFPGQRKHRDVAQKGPLFTHLPSEIRNLIFALVFGSKDEVVHIIALTKRLKHYACKRNTPEETRPCLACPFTYGKLLAKRDPIGSGTYSIHPGLALIRTCHQVYTECIPLLYSSNTFDFMHPLGFLYFTRSILSQRLAAITSLQLLWNINGTMPCRKSARNVHESHFLDLRRHWDPMWIIVKEKLPNLEKLRVVIYGQEMETYALQDELFQSLTGFIGLDEMLIEVRTEKTNRAELSALTRGVMEQSTRPSNGSQEVK